LDQEFNFPLEEREQFDMEGKVQQTNCSCIENLLLFDNAGKTSDEGEEGDNEGEKMQGMKRRRTSKRNQMKRMRKTKNSMRRRRKDMQRNNCKTCSNENSEALLLQAKCARHKE